MRMSLLLRCWSVCDVSASSVAVAIYLDDRGLDRVQSTRGGAFANEVLFRGTKFGDTGILLPKFISIFRIPALVQCMTAEV